MNDADQAAWDEYLDRLLAGERETPDAFLARRAGASEELRERVRESFAAAAASPDSGPTAAADAGLAFDTLATFA